MERTHTFFKNKKPYFTIKTKIKKFSTRQLSMAKSKGILPNNYIDVNKYIIE